MTRLGGGNEWKFRPSVRLRDRQYRRAPTLGCAEVESLETVIGLGSYGGTMTTLELLPETHTHEFVVTVLGEFRLQRGMSVVTVPRASRRLLAFLALHGRVVERAALAGALWPEASELHAYS